MLSNEQIIRDFIRSWSGLNVEDIVSYFAPDGVYHNVMHEPVTGHDNLRQFIGGFIKNWTRTDWNIRNLASSGNIVMVERLDRTQIGDRQVDLPCCGVIEMANGKIAVWRDYFDLATYMGAAAPAK